MTTFQSVVYAIIHGISEFLPIGSKAHHILIPYLIEWQPPTGALMGALSVGSFFALLVYFRHDWASMISCFLQVIIYRKRPMTLDERLPIFITVSTLPILLASYYFHDRLNEVQWSPLAVAGVFAALGLPLGFADQVGRKIKGMFDWNWLDTTLIGVSQAFAILPGCDHLTGALLGALILNYRREPAVKYAYFISAPILFSQMMTYLKEVNFHSSMPASDLNWLSFGVATIVSFFVGLLVIGGFMKHVQQKGLGQYIAYRWLLATAVFIAYWFKTPQL